MTEHPLDPRKDERPWLDRALAWAMPDRKRIRRFVFGSYFLKIVLIVVVAKLIVGVADNTHHVEQATCAVIGYAEKQSVNIVRSPIPATPQVIRMRRRQAGELLKLGAKMRETGVHCPPRPPSTLPTLP